MALLSRMLLSPLFVDIRPGAVQDLPRRLARRHVSVDGAVMVVVGPGLGEQVWDLLEPSMPHADVHTVKAGSLEAAGELQIALNQRAYDAVLAIGGGRTLDVAKYAATRVGLPMVAVATNLAHDGICSPVASLEYEGGKGSFGVAMPIAVVIDLDFVRRAPSRMVRAGIGDVLSNLSAIEDWVLAQRVRGEPVDGLSVTFARTAAGAVLHRNDGIDDDEFLVTLGESLVLSGMAMVVAGSSRPCSGACHEILHAIERLYPDVATHGELAGVGALFASFLRGPQRRRVADLAACLQRHGLPRSPGDLGLSQQQFAEAVLLAPSMRPDRYTILEHLGLDHTAVEQQVAAFVDHLER